jgi:hypothetical protein
LGLLRLRRGDGRNLDADVLIKDCTLGELRLHQWQDVVVHRATHVDMDAVRNVTWMRPSSVSTLQQCMQHICDENCITFHDSWLFIEV